MKSLNNLIITLLPNEEDLTSNADIQTLNTLKKSIMSTNRKYITIENAILDNVSYLAIALGKTSITSANYELYTNIIRYLRGLIMSRMNIGMPNIPNVNVLVPAAIRLPIVGKTDIQTTTIPVNQFKYLKYEKNKLIFDMRSWLREAIDWTIKQGNFYITKEDEGTHQYKLTYVSDDLYSYETYDDPPETVYLKMDDIIDYRFTYLMDLYFYLDGNKFYQINKRRAVDDTYKKTGYYDEIVEETDMTKQKENKLCKVYTNVQNRNIETNPPSQSFITTVYTDKQIIKGVEEKHKYEKLYKPYSDTSIYHDHINPTTRDEPDQDITYSFTRNDTSIEFNGEKYGIWFERKRTDNKIYQVSHATTRQEIITNYEKLIRINNDTEYQIECTREIKTVLSTQYPEFRQDITEEIYMYKATDLTTLVGGETLNGPYNKKTTIVTIDNNHKRIKNDVDIVREINVDWTYQKIESLATDKDDPQVTIKQGEELILEFEHDLDQIPGIHFYGYLYQPFQQIDFYTNPLPDELRYLMEDSVEIDTNFRDYFISNLKCLIPFSIQKP